MWKGGLTFLPALAPLTSKLSVRLLNSKISKSFKKQEFYYFNNLIENQCSYISNNSANSTTLDDLKINENTQISTRDTTSKESVLNSSYIEIIKSCWRNLRSFSPTIFCRIDSPSSFQRALDTIYACGVSNSAKSLNEAYNCHEYAIYLSFELGHYHPSVLKEITQLDTCQSHPYIIADISFDEDIKFSFNRLKDILAPIKPCLVKLRFIDMLPNHSAADNGSRLKEWIDTQAFLACSFAKEMNTTLCITGSTDIIIDSNGNNISQVHLDIKPLNRIPGISSALGALCASSIRANPDYPFIAVTAACTAFKSAAKEALKESKGPGSLAVLLVDHLSRLSLSPDKLSNSLLLFTTLDELQSNMSLENTARS